jgi:hypothetical protein
MSTPSAKDLLEQADQLMRRSRSVEDVPVLTELVADDIPDLTDRVYLPRGGQNDRIDLDTLSLNAASHAEREALRREPSLGASRDARASVATGETTSSVPVAKSSDADRAGYYTREQFDAALEAKLDRMKHSVYSQVMQQLELHATGEMKRKLREALEPALTQVALDIAAQVAEETSLQIQQVVANAVDNEVERLREQILSKRKETKN